MFGNPTARGYFQQKNLPPTKRNKVKWYMEWLCLLNKFDYMSKDAFAPLLAAEKGKNVSWAHVLFDRLMVEIEGKDKRKAQGKSRIAPFLQGLFEFKEVFAPTPLNFLTGTFKMENLSKETSKASASTITGKQKDFHEVEDKF